MKKYTLIITLVFATLLAKAQIEVGVSISETVSKDLNKSQLLQIKKATVHFNVPKSLRNDVENALKENWTYTNYTISSETNLNKKIDQQNLTFKLDVQEGPNPQCPIISLILQLKDYSSQTFQIARIILQPTPETVKKVQIKKTIQQKLNLLYNEGEFLNGGEYIGYNLTAINNLIASENSIWLDIDTKNVPFLNIAKEQEIYVPEYCLIKKNMFTGNGELQEFEKITKKYPYEITNDASKNSRFVVMTAQAGNISYFSLYDKTAKRIIYHHKANNQFKVTSKDFKILGKAMK